MIVHKVNDVFADLKQAESFGSDDITLTLMLRRAAGVIYSITSIPNAEIVYSHVNASATLMLSYNTEYNISIIATVCEHCNASKIITLKYGEYECFYKCTNYSQSTVNCGNPTKTVFSWEVITDVGYSDNSIAMEGAVANFSCPPGLVLTGPSTTTCMENGEWEPDPAYLDCKGIKFSQHHKFIVPLYLN